MRYEDLQHLVRAACDLLDPRLHTVPDLDVRVLRRARDWLAQLR